MASVEIALDTQDMVGESPFWDQQENALYWVDIIGKKISRYDPTTGDRKNWATVDFPTAIALRAKEPGAVLAMAGGVRLFDFEGAFHDFSQPDQTEGNRLNEGKCDPQGRLWVGSMQTNLNTDGSGREMMRNSGALFRVDPNGGNSRFTPFEFGISNTMAWSPDKRTFYFGDSIRNILFAFDYEDETGRVENPRPFLENVDLGFPDGSCIDDDGCLWNARFGAGKLLRITPDGQIDREVDLPVTNPTSCTFGGEDRKTLYVTSARFTLSDEQLSANPHEGSVLALSVDVSGPPDTRFAG